MRILEIGDRALFKREMPAVTDLLWSGRHTTGLPFDSHRLLNATNAIGVLQAIRKGDYDVIVCHAAEAAPWHEFPVRRRDTRGLWFQLTGHLLPWRSVTPMIVVDTLDRAEIPAHVLPLLHRADVYFKRELPLDLNRLLPANATTRQKEVIARHQAHLQPISLGISRWRLRDIPVGPTSKTTDIFFAGQSVTAVRQRDIALLRSLIDQGIQVDIAERRVSREEFYRRCAAAWLVWSPEGNGWDCFRHYESAACGAVPVMNSPSIRCRDPLEDGVHAFYYDNCRPLTTVVVDALADKARLHRMADAGRAHVHRHHTHEALCGMILDAASTAVGLRPTRRFAPDLSFRPEYTDASTVDE